MDQQQTFTRGGKVFTVSYPTPEVHPISRWARVAAERELADPARRGEIFPKAGEETPENRANLYSN